MNIDINKKADRFDVIVALMAATKAELIATVETQTLMQVLVKKGIASAEEIQKTRDVVERKSPKVLELYSMIKLLDDMIPSDEKFMMDNMFEKEQLQKEQLQKEKEKFMKLYGKMLFDRDSLTEEELNYLDSKLDFKKYWKEEDSKND